MTSPHDFLYFGSMRELADWRPESASSHAANVSNTPLVPRPDLSVGCSSSGNCVSSLLVCHDFRGGYHAYEASQGQCPSDTLVYTAEYLQLVSAFVYFSHKRVSIPPAAWINTLHRNGVKVLGTFLVENSDGLDELAHLFDRGSEGEFLFATQLARIAETYGFDGWLMNVESPFPWGKFSPLQLQQFLRELKCGTEAAVGPGSEIIWYDALTILNQLHWQNGLTLLNAPFFYTVDGLFTNYHWRSFQLHHTTIVARAMGRAAEVYCGIDCFGRGSLGGGGFGVGVALKEVRKEGLSAALFGPGWTYENNDPKDFHSIERRFWFGDGGPVSEHGIGPVSDHVKMQKSGTVSFFYTNFNRGFGEGFWLRGKKISSKPWVHVGSQSILPSYPSCKDAILRWDYDNADSFTGGWCLNLTAILPPLQQSAGQTYFCPLYKLGITCHRSLALHYVFKIPSSCSRSGELGLYWDLLVYPHATPQRHLHILSTPTLGWRKGTGLIITGTQTSTIVDYTLVEIGVFYRESVPTLRNPESFSQTDAPMHIMTLGELCVTTQDTESRNQSRIISSVVSTLVKDDITKIKLSWSVYATYGSEVLQRKRNQKSHWSLTTKDFAYFVVWKGDVMAGVAYCLEYTVDARVDEGPWRVSGVTWEGDIFDGPTK